MFCLLGMLGAALALPGCRIEVPLDPRVDGAPAIIDAGPDLDADAHPTVDAGSGDDSIGPTPDAT